MIFIIKDDITIRQRIEQFSDENHINITLEGNLALVESTEPEVINFFKEFEAKFVNDFGSGYEKF